MEAAKRRVIAWDSGSSRDTQTMQAWVESIGTASAAGISRVSCQLALAGGRVAMQGDALEVIVQIAPCSSQVCTHQPCCAYSSHRLLSTLKPWVDDIMFCDNVYAMMLRSEF